MVKGLDEIDENLKGLYKYEEKHFDRLEDFIFQIQMLWALRSLKK